MTGVEFWTLFLTGLGIIVTMAGGAFIIWKEVRIFDVKLAEQNRQLNYRVDQQSKRSDGLYQQLQDSIAEQSLRSDKLHTQFQDSMAEQSSRSDKLYQMFIDLLKEGRGK